MPTRLPRPARTVGVLIAPTLALGGVAAAAPAAAPTPAPAPAPAAAVTAAGQQLTPATPVPAGSVRVTVSLAAADPAGLVRAAHQPPSSDVAGRAARLRALAPSEAARARVGGYLHTHGFTVASSDAWTVTATGPDTAAEQVFATRLTRLAGGRVAATPAVLPAGLRGDVVAVTGLDTRPVFHRHTTGAGYGPAGLSSAYSATSGRGAGTTVGTVQFSGWTPGEAASYAQAENIPLAAGQIQTIPVGLSAAQAGTPDGAGGDAEAALDTEAILATAPAARQRVYVAANTSAGASGVYAAMASDAQGGLLTAASTSWGGCEPDTDPNIAAAVEQSITRLLAAGTTVLAASGDDGAYDCARSDPNPAVAGAPAVDFPASSPWVLAVGGTSLTGSPGTWQETAWGPAAGTLPPVRGGGGGTSTRSARPAYQSSLTGTGRLVPDIASAADPAHGIAIYCSCTPGQPAGWYSGGGTSAAAPAQTGLLVSMLSAYARTTGIGDIHPALYTHPGAFRDVTAGANGTYPAAAGYDQATGLGSPAWTTLAAAGLAQPDAIGQHYYDLGGPGSYLGTATAPETAVAGGRMQTFHGGTIYWIPATGAHAVHGLILARYQALGGPSSLAGFPTSDEQAVVGGRASTFTGAAIYWSPGTGAHEVHGLIRSHYLALGGPGSFAGLPTSDEQAVAGGRASTFTGAAIYWSPGTGAHEVHGLIRALYLALGGPGSFAGLPTSDETAVVGGRASTFTGATIYWSPGTGAHEVHGAIRSAYLSYGGPGSSLALPTSDEYPAPGGRQNTFQHGSITWNAASGATTVTQR